MIAFIESMDAQHLAGMKILPNRPSLGPEVIARVGKGDSQAFAELYEHSSSLLFTLALRILNNRDEAAELLQDVYIEVWRKAGNFDQNRGSPMAWLITLTRSRAIDRVRASTSRGRTRTDSLEDNPAEQIQSDLPDPLENRSMEELRSLVGDALTDLPAAQQEALELSFYDGLTHAEIAAKLDKPIGTIKTRIKLGMNKLRYTLRPCWEHK
jgi:RNA polymerase sigma-70 factor (ECF subfamily)